MVVWSVWPSRPGRRGDPGALSPCPPPVQSGMGPAGRRRSAWRRSSSYRSISTSGVVGVSHHATGPPEGGHHPKVPFQGEDLHLPWRCTNVLSADVLEWTLWQCRIARRASVKSPMVGAACSASGAPGRRLRLPVRRQALAARGMAGEIATRGRPAPIQVGRRWVIEAPPSSVAGWSAVPDLLPLGPPTPPPPVTYWGRALFEPCGIPARQVRSRSGNATPKASALVWAIASACGKFSRWVTWNTR
jgi:hypothetical protein